MAEPSDRSNRPASAGEHVPSGLRNAVLAVGGVLVFGALYLIVLRGEAILVDLSTMTERFWCF